MPLAADDLRRSKRRPGGTAGDLRRGRTAADAVGLVFVVFFRNTGGCLQEPHKLGMFFVALPDNACKYGHMMTTIGIPCVIPSVLLFHGPSNVVCRRQW